MPYEFSPEFHRGVSDLSNTLRSYEIQNGRSSPARSLYEIKSKPLFTNTRSRAKGECSNGDVVRSAGMPPPAGEHMTPCPE